MNYYCPNCSKLLLINEKYFKLKDLLVCSKCNNTFMFEPEKLTKIEEEKIFKKIIIPFLSRELVGLIIFTFLYYYFKMSLWYIPGFVVFPVIVLIITIFFTEKISLYNFNSRINNIFNLIDISIILLIISINFKL